MSVTTSKRAAAVPQTANEKLVLSVLNRLFNERDTSVVDEYFTADYKQHSAHFPDGPAPLKELATQGPPDLKFESGFIASNADLVMVQGRFSASVIKTIISVDMYRIENGKIAEHWDVIQEEVTPTLTGRPMFDPWESK